MAPRRPVARLIWWVERGLLVAGVVLFVLLVRRLGAAEVWSNLRLIGWGFLLVLGQEGVSYCLNTLGWRYAFPPPRPAIPFRSLVAARLGGEAINNLTPTATIGGEVVRIAPTDTRLKVPHMGWNDLVIDRPHPVLAGIETGQHAYFVHSYHFRVADPAHLLAHCDYGGPITAIVGRDNIVGAQFHPEKSQATGLRLIANFLGWRP